MCRGLAAGYDVEQNQMICTGQSSHTKTLGDREDHCIRLEVIVDDSAEQGYVVEVDDDPKQLEQWVGGKYITTAVLMTEHLAGIAERWQSGNNTKILRWLLKCQTYRRDKGNNYQYYAKFGGSNYQNYAKFGGSNDQYCAEFGGDNHQSHARFGGDNNQHCAKFGGDNYQNGIKFGGDNDQNDAKFGGSNNQSGITVGKKWYVGLATLTQYPNTTKLLKTAKDSWALTLPEYTRWVAEHPEQALEILGEEARAK